MSLFKMRDMVENHIRENKLQEYVKGPTMDNRLTSQHPLSQVVDPDGGSARQYL